MKDQATVYRARLSRRQLLFALCGIAVLPLWPSASAKSSNQRAFQFGYLTGSYLISGQPDDFRLLQESQLFLQDAIKTLSREKLDFVIFGGDNVIGPGKDDVNWQLFIDIAQSLSCPWQFVLGENDISGSIPVDPMRTYGRDWKGKGIETDKTYWSQDPLEGVHLIGLDTSEPNSTAGYLSGQQLAWLEKDLQTNANNFTIVVSHHPLLPPPPFDGGPPWDKYIVPQGPLCSRNHRSTGLSVPGAEWPRAYKQDSTGEECLVHIFAKPECLSLRLSHFQSDSRFCFSRDLSNQFPGFSQKSQASNRKLVPSL